jgi:hypothetical protein
MGGGPFHHPERRRYFYFSRPYSQNEFCLISSASIGKEDAPSPIDAAGKIIQRKLSRRGS